MRTWLGCGRGLRQSCMGVRPGLCNLFVDDVNRRLTWIKVLGMFQQSVFRRFLQQALLVSTLNRFSAGQAHDVGLDLLSIDVRAHVAQFKILLLLEYRDLWLADNRTYARQIECHGAAARLLGRDD